MKRQSWLSNDYLTAAARILIGFVFVIAAVSKVADPANFAKSIIAYELLPYGIINSIALVLPWLEMVCALFLIFGIRTKASAALVFTMLTVFTMAIVIATLQGKDLECGCFGDDTKVGWPKVAENTAFILVSLYVFLFPHSRFALGGRTES